MLVQLRPKEASTLFETDILFQSVYWSKVKSSLGWVPLAFDYVLSNGLKGDILVLLRPLSSRLSGAYVPQGPECGPDDPENYGPFLEALSQALSSYLDGSVAFIQYDLPWKSPYIGEDNGNQVWMGRPAPELQELRMNFGTRLRNLRKSLTDMTIADSVIVDLDLSEEGLLDRMKPKTRYNIRLAAKKGVGVFEAASDGLALFYNLYLETAHRHGFSPASYRHFQAIFSTHARYPEMSEVVFLFATDGEDLLSGAIIVVNGRRATYLFGASSNSKRNLMGCYALQWGAMRTAKEKGCLTYDMGSVAPVGNPSDPFYGLHRFKTGFGGRIFHGSGTWDYPLNPKRYLSFRNYESLFSYSASGARA